jgi:glutaminyl-tRNA synthetase
LFEDLNKTAPRVMAVLDPIKLVITIIQKIKKNGWKPKIIRKMKRRDLEKYLFRELFIEREDF